MSYSGKTVEDTPTKQVKTDSWMDDVMRPNISSQKSGKNFSNLLEMERFADSSYPMAESKNLEYSTDDIPMLPDVDDLQESLLYNESPNLPSVVTYKQLGSDIFSHGKSSLGNLDEIDISILTECLENEHDIEEPDEPWIWDQLFAQLSVKISSEAKAAPVEFKN